MSFTFNQKQTPKQILINLINEANPELETPIIEEDVTDIEIVSRVKQDLVTKITFKDGSYENFNSKLIDPLFFDINGMFFNELTLMFVQYNTMPIDEETGLPEGLTVDTINTVLDLSYVLKGLVGDAANLVFFENGGKEQTNFDEYIGRVKAKITFDKESNIITYSFDSVVFSDIAVNPLTPEFNVVLGFVGMFSEEQYVNESAGE